MNEKTQDIIAGRILISNYMGIGPLQKLIDTDWNGLMPVVRKVGEDLRPYWGTSELADAHGLELNIEFYCVNVQREKLFESLVKAIQWLNSQKNTAS